MIHLDVLGIRLVSTEEPAVLLLQERGGSRCLPIWIGTIEAAAIASGMEGPESARPMTHDLLAALLPLIDPGQGRVEILAVEDGVYRAQLHLGEHVVDARPSDCVAIAVRLGWEIQCPAALMDEVGVEVEAAQTDEVEAFRAFLDSVSADDFEDE
ncbi:bifunctional nuclease family protein [Tessaracoccus sp. MC1679]|uniref:bifunctional nuclease family protein n=1 Tax=unclassified Tessaracoccus TaxID=2635419 RepID=UPI00160206B3|nr:MULTISPECIES: bifunctional nuclease family protein [unclassified Tessaracoccus]MBB1512842.1 bifunctional nuclease family protein [Tessaracoccus sp. MC1627]MBB1516409.1 bifunctional nuclease family protein [Tessaracoccus sp. MC1679]